MASNTVETDEQLLRAASAAASRDVRRSALADARDAVDRLRNAVDG